MRSLGEPGEGAVPRLRLPGLEASGFHPCGSTVCGPGTLRPSHSPDGQASLQAAASPETNSQALEASHVCGNVRLCYRPDFSYYSVRGREHVTLFHPLLNPKLGFLPGGFHRIQHHTRSLCLDGGQGHRGTAVTTLAPDKAQAGLLQPPVVLRSPDLPPGLASPPTTSTDQQGPPGSTVTVCSLRC